METGDLSSGFSSNSSSPMKKKKIMNDIAGAEREEDVDHMVGVAEEESELGDEDDNNVEEREDAGDNESDLAIDEDRLTAGAGHARTFESFEFVHQDGEVLSLDDITQEKIPSNVGCWVAGDKVNTVNIQTTRKFVCVDFPGVIHSPIKAMAMLGGQDVISKAVSENLKLELTFRPGDPFSKPVISSVIDTQHFLVKVRRRRKVPATEDKNVGVDAEGDGFEYQVEMVGVVKKMYQFDKLCDFQYLPVSRQTDGQYTEVLSSIRPTFSDERQEYLSRQVPLFLPPFSFARRELPVTYNFESEAVSKGEKSDQTFIGLDRKTRKFGTHHIHFDHPGVPDSPLPEAVANLNKLTLEVRDRCLAAVTQLFDQRPIWSRNGLVALLEPSCHRYLKFILPICSYFIMTGPWRGMWCRFSYDPRKDPKAKQYQTVDYRIRSVLNRQKVESKRGQDICRFSQVNSHKSPVLTAVLTSGHSVDTVQSDGGSCDLVYKFLPDQLPPYRQMRYQVCDVYHPDIQQRLHENDGKETACTERDGWCVPDFTAICRDILSATVEKLFDQ